MENRRNPTYRAKPNKKGGVKLLIIILVSLIIIAGILFVLKVLNKGQVETNAKGEQNIEETKKEEPKVQIVDINSKTRPYAVMINNNHDAWPQCGLKDAYLVYEIIAEGGITRMMALYKDKLPEKVGSVRSARHYFIDYADENDAIFIHWGGSPQAYSRINTGVADLDGMELEGSVFFRDKSLKRDYEHTGFVNLVKAAEYAENKGYARETNEDLLLNYSATEIELNKKAEVESANEITLKYSNYHTTSYEYDAENNRIATTTIQYQLNKTNPKQQTTPFPKANPFPNPNQDALKKTTQYYYTNGLNQLNLPKAKQIKHLTT